MIAIQNPTSAVQKSIEISTMFNSNTRIVVFCHAPGMPWFSRIEFLITSNTTFQFFTAKTYRKTVCCLLKKLFFIFEHIKIIVRLTRFLSALFDLHRENGLKAKIETFIEENLKRFHALKKLFTLFKRVDFCGSLYNFESSNN